MTSRMTSGLKYMKTIFRIALIPSVGIMLAALITAFTVAQPAEMKLDETKHNFGFIRQGEIVTHTFTFTNSGEEPLIISNAEVECTCTTVDYPKQPIMRGAKGTIKVTFDSKSALDRQERTVVFTSNAKNQPVTITFKAVVLKKK